jgi:hypothetical protein
LNAKYISGEKEFGQIENVPTGMIASADYNKVQTYEEIKLKYQMSHSCKSRGFQDLLGYVDFKV